MTACGAACGCHADCPMVCTFTSRHEGPCDWWLRRGGDQEQARGHVERKAGKPRLTSGNSHEHGFDRGSMTANETGPGAASTASRSLATGPDEEDR